jgi:N-acyl-D-amino-acid deacylase
MWTVGVAACSSPAPPSAQQPIVSTGPSCDEQVDNAVIALNAANATANAPSKGPGGSGAILAFGFGTKRDNAVVDQLVNQFQINNSALYTPPASTTPGGTTYPLPYWESPGITVSATYKNKLVFVRSYGYGDTNVYAEPDSRFRLASVSKSFTGMGILKLVHDGLLTLDYQPFNDPDFVKFIGGTWGSGTWNTSACGAPVNLTTSWVWDGCGVMNPELSKITVNELLHHAGGWNRYITGVSVEPPFLAWPLKPPGGGTPISPIVAKVGGPTPPDCKSMVRYFMNQPLQFEPGAYSSYSNLGFCVLGEVIAYKSGLSYASFTQQNVMQPLGMSDTALGYTLKSQQLDREVAYFDDDPNEPSVSSVFGGTTTPQYGGYVYMGTAAASGAWVSSAIDLARFTSAIDTLNLSEFGPTSTEPAWPGKLKTLTEQEEPYDSTVWNTVCYPPPIGCISTSSPATDWYGMGWDNVWPYGTTPQTWYWDKGGGMSGTSTEIAIYGVDDWTVTTLMNGGPPDECGSDPKCVVPEDLGTLNYNIWNWLRNQSTDYFPQYSSPTYTDWQSLDQFNTAMSTAALSNLYPSRVDGQTATMTFYPKGCTPAQIMADLCSPVTSIVQQYRARLGSPTAQGPMVYYTNQDCSEMQTLLTSGTNGPLVSLQKFQDPNLGNWRYQAVFAAP